MNQYLNTYQAWLFTIMSELCVILLTSRQQETMMTIVEAIRNRINEIGVGESFTSTQFNALGTRASVDQTLSRLVKQGEIISISRGVFVRPKRSRYVGEVMPEPSKVAQAIATAHGETIQVHGAEAARRLGLTTQMPLQAVFYTSGPSRELKLGNLPLILKHVARRKLALSGRPSGLALSALWYLGKEQVNTGTIKTIREKLTPQAFEEFKAETLSMPAWMADTLRRYEQESLVPDAFLQLSPEEQAEIPRTCAGKLGWRAPRKGRLDLLGAPRPPRHARSPSSFSC
jgi:hypothetical protein